MTKIDRLTIHADEVEAGVFAVQCRAIDGRWLQHEGPKGFAFFTEAQARALAARVYAACKVNEQHWISGGTGYGTFDHEMALIEAEYWEA